MKLLKKNKIKKNTELKEMGKEMGVFNTVAGNQLPNQLQKRVLPALFHLRFPSQSHQRSARGRTRLTTVTFISCRSFQQQLLYLTWYYLCLHRLFLSVNAASGFLAFVCRTCRIQYDGRSLRCLLCLLLRIRLSLGRRLDNLLPAAQRTNALTNGVVGRTRTCA